VIALLLATLAEARPLLERLQAARLPDRPFETYRFAGAGARPEGIVVLSGMGSAAAGEAAEYLLAQPGVEAIVNVGLCGSLGEAAVGAIYCASHVWDGDALLSGGAAAKLAPAPGAAWRGVPAAALASVSRPVFEPARRAELGRWAELVDMEGYAAARACLAHNRPCYMLKGVSDLADGGGRQAIQRNLRAVCERLAERVVTGLGPSPGAARESLARRLARFIRVEHTLFSLPLIVAGAYLAARAWPPWPVLALVLLCGAGARVVAMSVNRILDRRLDAMNPRTARREIPSGQLSITAAWAVAGAGLAVYLLSCAGLGKLVMALSPLPLAVLVSYPLLKRFTSLCHFGVGLCIGMSPIAAFVAASGTLAFTAEVLLLGGFAFLWISGFDIIYALQDLESDRRTGVRSIPAALGAVGAQGVSALCHAIALAALASLWWRLGAGAAAGGAAFVAAAAFATAYMPWVPLPARFFPVSAIAGIGGAMVPLLGGMP
jgi:4-hydroxybenzoate polyprenyltransferase